MSKPKSQTGSVFLILNIIIVITIIISLGFIYWQNSNKTSTIDIKDSDKDIKNLSLEEVISGADSLLKNKYPSSDAEFIENLNTYSPPYRPANTDFYIAGINGATLTVQHMGSTEISWQKLNEQIIVDLDEFLTKNGFIKNNKKFDDIDDRYSSSQIICDFNDDSIIVTLNCAKISDYESVVDSIGPFAVAYKKIDPTMKDGRVVMTPPKIFKNQESDSQSANLMIGKYGFIGGSTASFSTQSNGEWVFNGEHQ